MIDLQQFCSKEPTRYYLNAPWTRGDFTYATNGHVLVRVPKRDGIGDVEKAPDAGRLFALFPTDGFTDAEPIDLPPLNERPCDQCEGTGHYHPCDDCECGECERCDGSATTNDDYQCGVHVRGVEFAQGYVRMLWALPGLQLPPGPLPREAPTSFRFEGGEGQIMPLRAPVPAHFKILTPNRVMA